MGMCSLVELRSPALSAKKTGLVSFMSSNFGLIRSVWKKMDIKLSLYLVDDFLLLSIKLFLLISVSDIKISVLFRDYRNSLIFSFIFQFLKVI